MHVVVLRLVNVAPNGEVTPVPVTESVLGVVPSFGLTWRF